MVNSLVFEEDVLQISNCNLDSLIAMFDIVFIALLFVCRNVSAVMPRKLDRQAQVTLAVAERESGNV